MTSPDQQDTTAPVLDSMAGPGASSGAIADQHATNDVRNPPAQSEAQPKQADEAGKHEATEEEQEKAAIIIQRSYRGYKTRRELDGLGLDASTRWLEAVKEAQWRHSTRPQMPSTEGEEPLSRISTIPGLQARESWKRVGSIARHAGGNDNIGDGIAADENGQYAGIGRTPTNVSAIDSENASKMMDIQYFLEMVDTKHRYGSNLRKYHNYWKNSPSNQNFFYWLDYGDGKNVDLPQCPRDRLEKGQVRYLTREERMNYLVKVDEVGRFRWAKNGERVTTDSEKFRDSINGVVPVGDKTPRFKGNSPEGNEIADISSSSSNSDDESESAKNEAKPVKKPVYVSPAAIFNRLTKSSSKKKDKWIFVADTSFRVYIGIKESGAFQHSSFLRGARITAAGVIKINDGQLLDLDPLSGHYRPQTANFRRFVRALEDQNVDMSHISITKSYAVLLGTEGYGKLKKEKQKLHDTMDSLKAKYINREEDSEHPENGKGLAIRTKTREILGGAP